MPQKISWVWKKRLNTNKKAIKNRKADIKSTGRDTIFSGYINEGKGDDFDYKIGPLIILSNAFLLNPSRENFLKIKNKLNMRVFNEFKESNNAQYKSISWVLKMIFLTGTQC